MKKSDVKEYTIVVRPTSTGQNWRAQMKGISDPIAQGETPMIAIRNLAIVLSDQEERAARSAES